MNNDILREWFKYGLDYGARYMLVLADIDTLRSRPAYVYEKEGILSVIKFYTEEDHRSLIVDIYSYAQDFELQLLDKQRQDYS